MDINIQKCAIIAIMGAPNVGKSTLVNNIMGCKVSIVSPKVQTTRASIKAIYTDKDTQLVFVDTPGVFSPKAKLEKAIVKEAWSRIYESDSLALIVDAVKGICNNTKMLAQSLSEQRKEAILVINKIDRIKRQDLLKLSEELNQYNIFSKTFMVSALKGDGTKQLVDYFIQNAPEGNFAYPEDQISDAPIKFFAAELTREKIFLRLQQEIPYAVTVETEKWEETDKSINIHQIIYVRKNGQKSIILGAQGQMIKNIGLASRKELERILEKKVNLFLFVKVRENWIDNPEIFNQMGFNTDQKS